MIKKKSKENLNTTKSSPIVTNVIGMFFDLIKHAIKDFEQGRSIKKIDKFSEHFSNLEHLVIKLEEKVKESRKEVEHLKTLLLWGYIVNVILLITIIFQIAN